MAPSYQSSSRASGRAPNSNVGSQGHHEAVNQESTFSGQPVRPAPTWEPAFKRPLRPMYDAENSKTPGPNPQSAHFNKSFPCTYEACNRRFDNEKSLKAHKEGEHDYCRVCDEDFENDETLHLHKMQSEKHVICNICGIEFMSEPGRDRHAQQMHAAQQNIQCRGCHKTFPKGSALLLHFEQNACKPLQSIYMADRQINGKEMLEANRALLAMEIEQVAKEHEAKKADSRTAMSMLGTDVESETDGGVRLQQSLLDDPFDEDSQADLTSAGFDNERKGEVNEFQNLIDHASSMHSTGTLKNTLQMPLLASNSHSSAASTTSVSTTATAKACSGNYPALAPQSRDKGKGKENVIAGMDKLSVSGSVKSSEPGAWGDASRKLFPNANPTPVPADMDIGNLKGIKVGEDAAATPGFGTVMTANPIDNKFYCPFPTCDKSAEDMYKMIEHMQQHKGVDNRCSSCLRMFKTPSALTAHMESNSTRCNIRNTKGFMNAIHMVSGGFLGAYGRMEDGTIKLESHKKPDSFW